MSYPIHSLAGLDAPVRKRRPLAHRFWSKVDASGECWLWTASLSSGYGQFYVGLQDGVRRHVRAHRVAWELTVGPIPDRLVLDHLCKTKRCVNPAHLEPVTLWENVKRG